MYNESISRVGDILDMATEMGLVDKRGAFYSYGETRLGQGRESAKQFLRDNSELTLDIESQIREKAVLPHRSYVPPAEDVDEILSSSEDEESDEG
jgi:recombination protein RecA